MIEKREKLSKKEYEFIKEMIKGENEEYLIELEKYIIEELKVEKSNYYRILECLEDYYRINANEFHKRNLFNLSKKYREKSTIIRKFLNSKIIDE